MRAATAVERATVLQIQACPTSGCTRPRFRARKSAAPRACRGSCSKGSPPHPLASLRLGGAFPWIACIGSVILSYQDRVVQVLHQEVHVDPVGHCTLADVLETCYLFNQFQKRLRLGDGRSAGRIDAHIGCGAAIDRISVLQ
jgi:hypothetical protein